MATTDDHDAGMPLELVAALFEDPDAEALFDGLEPEQREEYAQYVREAKKPETRTRRGSKVVELVLRRDQRKAQLKARGKAPITIAIDDALNEVIAGSLKEDGFRKRGRTWTLETAASRRTVYALGHWSNRTTNGLFHLFMGFSYPALGLGVRPEDGSFFVCSPGYLAGYLPPFTFDDVENERDRARVREELTDRWDGDYGRAFLDEADDPRYLVRHLLSAGDSHGIFRAIQLSEALGDEDTERTAVQRYLEDLRSDAHVPDPRGNPNAMGWMVRKYSLVLDDVQRVGIVLDEVDRSRATSAVEANLKDLREGGRQVQWYRRDGEIAKLDALARFLGMDVDVAAEVERGRALYSGPMDVSPIQHT